MVATAVLATLGTVQYPVSDNIRYVVGLLRVSGYPPAETFTHRPIVYRLLMAMQAWLPDVASRQFGEPHSVPRLAAFETGLNVVSVGWALGAAALLWAGLRRNHPQVAWVYGIGAYATLAFLTPMLGEPDWYAAMFAVAAVGAGLLGNRWLGGSLSGFLLALAALVKFVTLPIALAALLVLWALDARRAAIATVAAGLIGSLTLVVIAVWVPWEIGWMLDIRALQPFFWDGLTTVTAIRDCLVQLAVMWPAVILVPAFFLGAGLKERLVAAAALVLAAAPIVLQGEYWLYHTIGMVVVSCLLAVRTLLRSRGALFWPMVACSAWTALVFVVPWRFHVYAGLNRGAEIVGHGKRVVLITAACAVVLFVLQRWALRQPDAQEPALATTGPVKVALAVVAALLASQTPPALAASTESRRQHNDQAADVRGVIGENPVVYLTPGWSTYFLGNPTRCRYPSPLFLQRRTAPEVVTPAHRDENLACLAEAGARWLVWKQDWLRPETAAVDVLAAIDRTWDCARAEQVAGYVLCPRLP